MVDKAIALLKIVKEHLENNKTLCPFPQRDIIYSVFLNNGALKDEFISAFPIEKASDFHRIIWIMGTACSSGGFAPNDEVGSVGYGNISRKLLIIKINEILNVLNSNNQDTREGIKMNEEGNYDIFISHASEDKTVLARPLAKELLKLGYNVFLDELTIKLGDSITDSINQGLSQAKYCVLIISPTFLKKNWTKAELNSITNLYISSDKKLLPIWHNVTYEDIKGAAPLIVDLRAVDSSKGVGFLVGEIVESIGTPSEKTLETNYIWDFHDFSEPVQLSILKNLENSITNVELEFYHSALEEGVLYMNSIRNQGISDAVLDEFQKTYKAFEDMLIADSEDLWNDR